MAEMSPEERAALEEKLKNMSPEEIAEWQKSQCIFCRIISGEIDSRKVYEDNDFIAAMDINPANPGHLLIMPKEHYSIMPMMPPELIGSLFILIKKLSNVLLKALEVKGTSTFIANGGVAGQKAPHFMVHLIPRVDGDHIDLNIPVKDIPSDLLEEFTAKLKKVLSGLTPQKKVSEDSIRRDMAGNTSKKDTSEDKKIISQENESPADGYDSPEDALKDNPDTDENEVSLDDISRLFR